MLAQFNTRKGNTSMKLSLCGLLTMVMFLTGCSTTLKPRPLDATGKFATPTRISAGGIKTVKPFQEKYKTLVYVKFDGSVSTKFNDFWVESFKNMGVFAKVARKSDLESLVIERKLTDKVTGVSDLIGLHQLQQQIGLFLIVEPDAEWKEGYDYIASLKAVDPETGETVLYLEQNAFNWSGLDDPLFFPLLNAFLQWSKGESISTASPK